MPHAQMEINLKDNRQPVKTVPCSLIIEYNIRIMKLHKMTF